MTNKIDMNDNYLHEFGRRLNMLRTERDVSMASVAESVGSTKAAISKYERGLTDPGLTMLKKLSRYYGVTLDWLCGDSDIDKNKYADTSMYNSVIDKCIEKNVNPEKLDQLISLIGE